MEFINLSHPSQADSAALRRRAHSYAARAAHARVRRAQVALHRTEGLTEDENKSHSARREKSKPEIIKPLVSRTDIKWPSSRVRFVEQIRKLLYYPNPLSMLSVGRTDPFASTVKAFSKQDSFLFDYYITAVVPYLKIHCGVLRTYTTFELPMKAYWVRLALTDVALLSGLFMLTCRYINVVHRQVAYSPLAIEYKLSCLQALNAVLASDSVPDDSTVCLALMLALDEIMEHDLRMASKHVQGAMQMVDSHGGAQAIGLSPVVASMLHKYVYEKHLLEGNQMEPCGAGFMIPSEA